MFCGKCGKELPDNAKFCGACGNPIESTTSAAANPFASMSGAAASSANAPDPSPAPSSTADSPVRQLDISTPPATEEKSGIGFSALTDLFKTDASDESAAPAPVQQTEEAAAPAPTGAPVVDAPAPAESQAETPAASAQGFVAAGSGANPFASFRPPSDTATGDTEAAASAPAATAPTNTADTSLTGKVNDVLTTMNASAEVAPFNGAYTQTQESNDIAAKSRKAIEERAAKRNKAREEASARRGKKPIIAGFEEDEDVDIDETSPFAEGLPAWDLVPEAPFMVDRTAS